MVLMMSTLNTFNLNIITAWHLFLVYLPPSPSKKIFVIPKEQEKEIEKKEC